MRIDISIKIILGNEGGGGLIYVSREKKQKRKSQGFLPYSVTVNVIINNAYLKIASLC